MENLTSVWPELGNDDFLQLKRITVVRCGRLQNLVDISSSSQLPRFSNLRDITIESCDNLNYFFPASMARRLSQLRSINAYCCKRMDCVFYGKEEDVEVEFPNLIKLDLRDLSELKGLWVDMDNAATKISSTSSILFHSVRLSNLQDLVINGCPLLKVAFSSSVVEQLVQLKTLEIEICDQMEYIVGSIGGEEDTRTSRSIFPMLTSIEIYNLPQLSNFCQDSTKMKTLVARTQSPSTSNQTVALMKEVIPNESQTRSESSHSSRNLHVQSIFFCSSPIRLSNLQELVLIDCHSLQAIFSTSVAEQLLQLQTLTIEFCEKVEYIVATDLPGEEEEKHTKTSRLVFPMLTTIKLENLPQLVTFCADTNVFLDWHSLEEIKVYDCPKMKTLIEANQNTSTILTQSSVSINEILFKIPPEFQGSLPLEELKVKDCDNVTNLFSSDVAKLLVKLQSLKVKSCEKIEEIISKGNEEAVNKIAFPQLKSMELEGLPNLRSFYSGIHSVELSFLKYLQFDESNFQLKTSLLECSLNLKEMRIKRRDYSTMGDHFTIATIKEQMFQEVYIQSIEEFMILCKQPHEYSSRIRDLHFTWCFNLLDGIPWNLITCLERLEKLVVYMCNNAEKIFEYERVNTEEVNITIFSDLKEITLDDLENLKHIFNKIPKWICGFQKLEKLVVKRCASVQEIFEFEEESATTFSHLEEITLYSLENLKHIFNNFPVSVVGFQKLRRLHIEYCNNLRNIFSVSSVKSLVQLEELDISYCPSLEEIVAKQEIEVEDKEAIVFPKLTSINVENLAKLECFYSGKCSIQLPVLKSLSFSCCDAIQTFSNGSLSTPNLHQIQIDFMDNRPCDGDLNAVLVSSKEEKMREKAWQDEDSDHSLAKKAKTSGNSFYVAQPATDFERTIPQNQSSRGGRKNSGRSGGRNRSRRGGSKSGRRSGGGQTSGDQQRRFQPTAASAPWPPS